MELGYAMSSEEHRPNTLVAQARRAEEVGFSFALISDHYHPWVDAQGHSPFVWSVIGGIAQVTDRLRLGTGVTCPIMRIHPAILAQAAATAADMLPGRFFFGVGTGDVKAELIKVYAEKKFGQGVEAAYNPHNQYLQTAAALGLPGLAGLLALALAPLVRSVRRRHFLFLNFLLIVGLNSLTESVLEVQAGVLFVALFYLLLGREGKDGSPPPG